MTEKEGKKMDKLKNRLIKLQEKIQDRVEDFQETVQTKYENSRLSKIVSHLSEDKSDTCSIDSKDDNKVKETSSESREDSTDKEDFKTTIPDVIINEPLEADPKDVCKDFITAEKNNSLCKGRSLSTSNLVMDQNYHCDSHSSSESCLSCLSSSDDR